MKFVHTLIAGAALTIAPAALAQTTQQTSPAPAATETAAATPAPAQAGAVTDAEIEQFATAALAVNKIQNDASVAAADKGAQMSAAVTATGLTADRFNAINQAMQTDKALNTRIQTAGAKLVSTPGAAPAPQQP
jgi:hypothetical protein